MPRGLKIYLALVPVFPPLYLAGFYGLKFLKGLSPLARYALFGFLALELLAALLSPRPLISLILALLGLFILGLIGTGIWFGDTQKLKYLLYGYLIVYITAIITTATVYGDAIFIKARLVHFHYSSTSLGIAGVLGIFLAVGIQSLPRWIRSVAELLGFIVLLFSGSRGALIALFVGAMTAVVQGGRRFLQAFTFGGLIISIAALLAKSNWKIGAIVRLLNLKNLSGRDKVWQEAIGAFHQHPLGGVGPYQLGVYLDSLNRKGCHLWVGLEHLGFHCSAWLQPLHEARLIAHNTVLHALGETGVFGTIGWFALYFLATYAVIRARDPLLSAIFFAFVVMGLVDNPTLVPSHSPAEVFWVAVGIALRKSGLALGKPVSHCYLRSSRRGT